MDVKTHKTLIRYGAAGILFTTMGPIVFLACYPAGAILAALLTETIMHSFRYHMFKRFVFPRLEGYIVEPVRYFLSVLPGCLAGILAVALLNSSIAKVELVTISTLTSITITYAWSKYVYKWKPRRKDIV